MLRTNSKPNRRSTRLRGYDYGQAGAYFVTICTHERACLFGGMEDGVCILSSAGESAAECWRALPDHFSYLEAAPFVVMPNHVHGIVIVRNDVADPGSVGARHASPLQPDPPASQLSGAPVDTRPRGIPAASLGAIVAAYKAAVTRRVRRALPENGNRVWQRGYWDHVVRDEEDLARICEYIESNPQRWESDAENLAASKPRGV